MQLEQVQLDVLALPQELILVVRFLNLGVLLANVPNCSLHLLLHILDLLSGFDQLEGRFKDRFILIAALAFLYLFLHLLLLGRFIIDQSLHMLPKLLIAVKSLINIVSRLEILETAKHSLSESHFGAFLVFLVGRCFEH